VRFFKALYTPLLNLGAALQAGWSSRSRGACSAGSLFVFTRLGAEFIPQLDEGTMTAAIHPQQQRRAGRLHGLAAKIRKAVAGKFPEISACLA
jgi:Cu/Ag efflux pump CusA